MTRASRLVDVRTGLWAGVVGPVLFVVAFLVEGALRPGYDPVRLQVSYLSLGEGGWLQVASFLVSGALIVLFAIALRGVLASGPAAVVGPLFVALAGAGLLIAGVFSTPPAFGYPPGTPDGFPSDLPPTAYLHLTGALFGFGGLILAPAVMARRFSRERALGWAVYSAGTAVVVLVFQLASTADSRGKPLITESLGLVQRIALIAGLGWVAAIALLYLRTEREPADGAGR